VSEELVYIISPYAGDIEANVKFAIRCCRLAIQQGYTPIAVHLLYPLRHCAAAWVCGTKISRGMDGEIQAAKQLNIPIRYVEEIK